MKVSRSSDSARSISKHPQVFLCITHIQQEYMWQICGWNIIPGACYEIRMSRRKCRCYFLWIKQFTVCFDSEIFFDGKCFVRGMGAIMYLNFWYKQVQLRVKQCYQGCQVKYWLTLHFIHYNTFITLHSLLYINYITLDSIHWLN